MVRNRTGKTRMVRHHFESGDTASDFRIEDVTIRKREADAFPPGIELGVHRWREVIARARCPEPPVDPVDHLETVLAQQPTPLVYGATRPVAGTVVAAAS